jgi:hypothetical protein
MSLSCYADVMRIDNVERLGDQSSMARVTT